MDTADFKSKIISLVEKAGEQLDFYVRHDYCDCKIHIPKNQGEYRISEQELKYIFIELFCKDDDFDDYTYSIETPTKLRYKFTQNGKLTYPKSREGRKANIDIVIFRKQERVCILEFKANNADAHSHAKDFMKLRDEPGKDLIRIFVELYTETDDTTLNNVANKLFQNKYGVNLDDNTIFIGLSVNHKKSGYKKIRCCEKQVYVK